LRSIGEAVRPPELRASGTGSPRAPVRHGRRNVDGAFLSVSAASRYQEQLRDYAEALLQRGSTKPPTTQWQELARRSGNGIEMALLWNERVDLVKVAVSDGRCVTMLTSNSPMGGRSARSISRSPASGMGERRER
jgi:hypothetical protein